MRSEEYAPPAPKERGVVRPSEQVRRQRKLNERLEREKSWAESWDLWAARYREQRRKLDQEDGMVPR